jgi:hypothetical protein
VVVIARQVDAGRRTNPKGILVVFPRVRVVIRRRLAAEHGQPTFASTI